MSNLLYEYMIKEYNDMSKQERISKYREECCDYCRYKYCFKFNFPEDIYKLVQSNMAWIPGKVTCSKFEWT